MLMVSVASFARWQARRATDLPVTDPRTLPEHPERRLDHLTADRQAQEVERAVVGIVFRPNSDILRCRLRR